MRSIGPLVRTPIKGFAILATLVVAACSGDKATGTSSKPTSIVFIGSNTLNGTVGQALPASLQIEIRDAAGRTVPNVAFTVVVSSGSIAGAPAKTIVGTTSLGTWTLGTTAGSQTLTVQSTGLPPLVLTATAAPGAASAITTAGVPTSGNGQLGAVAPISPKIKIADSFNNPIVGVAVAVEVTGGGSVQFPAPITDATGTASVGAWTLGPSAAVQKVTMTPPGGAPVVFTVAIAGQFDIELRFNSNVPQVVQAAAAQAVARIKQFIIGDLPDQSINAVADGCSAGAGVVNQSIDDILILVRMESLGTASGTIAFAGFCTPVRTASPFLPFIGFLAVNADVLPTIQSDNSFAVAVMTHELMHAMGFGTFWQPFGSTPLANLLQGVGSGTPMFIGAQSRAAYVAAFGSTPVGVPVEGSFGAGTANSHWRESSLRTELMTGFAEVPGTVMPLSAISIGAMGDIGYQVTTVGADAFAVPVGGGPPSGAALTTPQWMMNDTRPPGQLHDRFGNPMFFAPPALPKR